MTALRPERAGDQEEPSSYEHESTGDFAAAVDGLADPLNDPLPGHEQPLGGSPWFRPSQQPSQQPQAPAYGAADGPSGYDPTPPPAQPWQADGSAGYGWGRQEAQHQQQSYDAAAYGDQSPAWATPEPEAERPQEPEPPRPPRRRRAAAGGETAVMPTLDPDDTPGAAVNRAPREPETPSPGRAARRRAAAAGGAAAVGPVAGEEAGGRAARRKAAQQASRRGGGRRARGGHAAGAPAPETAEAAAQVPRSRVEARRAARAAKESPGVIASRVMGEVFITLGVLMLLFVTYQLWWSNILAHQEAGGAANSLQNSWNSGDSDGNSTFTTGQNFAIIYIPKLDVKAPIAQGVSKPQVLDKGMVGHYDGAPFNTAMPWDKTGNFALAAHRNTHGEPFRYINKLVKGDKVVVETQSTYYTYEITSMLPQTSPSNTSVIEPIPTGSGFTKAGRYITLTTCTPEFTSTYRLIVWGKMVGEQPRSKGTPAVLQGG